MNILHFIRHLLHMRIPRCSHESIKCNTVEWNALAADYSFHRKIATKYWSSGIKWDYSFFLYIIFCFNHWHKMLKRSNANLIHEWISKTEISHLLETQYDFFVFRSFVIFNMYHLLCFFISLGSCNSWSSLLLCCALALMKIAKHMWRPK